MTDNDINRYTIRVSQSSKSELVVVVYDIITQYIDEALASKEESDFDGYRANLKKARSFISSLISGLDMKYPVSQELLRIYLFFNKIMVKAEINKETEELIRVKNMLTKLREAFFEVSKEDKSGPVLDNVQQVYSGLTYSKTSLNDEIYSNHDRGYRI